MSALSVTYSDFTPLTTISSSQVDQNFADIVAWAAGNIGSDNFATLTGVMTWNIASTSALAQNITSVSTVGVTTISATGVLDAAKSVFKVTSNANQTTGDAGIYFELTSATSSIPVLYVGNSGVGHSISVVQSGVLAASKAAVNVSVSGVQTTGRGVFYGEMTNSSSTKPVYAGKQVGTGPLISLQDSSAADAFVIDSDGNPSVLYAPPLQNFIQNGNFDFWQRGTSVSVSSSSIFYQADRFAAKKSGAAVFDFKRSTDVPTLTQSGFQSTYSAQIDMTTLDSSIAAGDFSYIKTAIEGYDYAQLKGRQVTLQFWVKSTKTGTFCVGFQNSIADRSYVAEYTVSVTNTWEKKSITLTLNPTGGTDDYTTGRGLGIVWAIAAGSTYQTTANAWQTGEFFATSNQVNGSDSASNDFLLAQVGLYVGAKARPFQRAGITIEHELNLCQRYYEKSYNQSSAPGAVSNSGIYIFIPSASTAGHLYSISFKVSKRAAPTVLYYSNATGASGTARNITAVADVSIGAGLDAESGTTLNFTSVANNFYSGHWTAESEFA